VRRNGTAFNLNVLVSLVAFCRRGRAGAPLRRCRRCLLQTAGAAGFAFDLRAFYAEHFAGFGKRWRFFAFTLNAGVLLARQTLRRDAGRPSRRCCCVLLLDGASADAGEQLCANERTQRDGMVVPFSHENWRAPRKYYSYERTHYYLSNERVRRCWAKASSPRCQRRLYFTCLHGQTNHRQAPSSQHLIRTGVYKSVNRAAPTERSTSAKAGLSALQKRGLPSDLFAICSRWRRSVGRSARLKTRIARLPSLG